MLKKISDDLYIDFDNLLLLTFIKEPSATDKTKIIYQYKGFPEEALYLFGEEVASFRAALDEYLTHQDKMQRIARAWRNVPVTTSDEWVQKIKESEGRTNEQK